MTAPIIDTPRGSVIVNEATMKASLTWNPNFQPRWQGNYSRAQVFVDNEVLRGCEPSTPLLTGMMIMSGILGTTPGEGVVSWIAPYSRHNYFSPRAVGSQTGPLRGPFWFERWKAVNGQRTIAGARKIAGGQ